MTWILGTAVPFGYGALISDTRASWRDGQYVDGLQKIYPVGPWMMAGFAGSVMFGFQTIAYLQHWFGPPTLGRAYMPEVEAWRLYRRVRRAFAAAPLDIRSDRCSIILVGVSPSGGGPFGPNSRCLRMTSPHFIPERAAPLTWHSIGNGAIHDLAKEFANQSLGAFSLQAQGETLNRGGTAFSTASEVGLALANKPMAGIGESLQIGTVWRDRHEIRTLKRTPLGPGTTGWERVDSAARYTTWEAFQRVCEQRGLRAIAATT